LIIILLKIIREVIQCIRSISDFKPFFLKCLVKK
jgi:hypothetical protein